MKKMIIAAVLLTIFATAIFAQMAEDQVVASVNDDIKIMLSELQAEVQSLPREQLEVATTKEGVDEILDQIIRRKLLAQQARALQVDTLAIVQKAIENSIENLLAEFMVISLRQSIQPVTPDQAQEYYASNESLFYTSPSLQLQQIVVGTSEEATEVQKKLEKGDFDKLMAEYPGVEGGANSGNLGLIPAHQLSADVYNQIADLSPGEWAGPIQTGAGFHFIKVLKINPSQKMDYDEIAEELQQQLTANMAGQEVGGYIQSLVDEATITRNNAAIREAILQRQPQSGMGGN